LKIEISLNFGTTDKVTGKFKNIIPFTLLLVFLLPSIVKLTHHYELTECKVHKENNYHVPHERCPICDFEFSIFLAGTWEIDFQEEHPLAYFCNNYDSVFFSDPSQFSFLLRAPPVIANSIYASHKM